MAEVEIKVKVDGIEYTQDQLAKLAKGGKEAAEAMDDAKKSTKKVADEQGYFSKKIDEVKDKFNNLKNSIKEIGTGFKKGYEGLKGFVSGFKTAGGAAKNFGTITKAAMAATGIGLLITAVLSLVNYFKNLEGGAKALKKVMAGLGAIVTNISKAFSLVVQGKFSEAFDTLKNAVTEATEAVDQQFASSDKLFKIQQKNIVQNAKLTQTIEAQKKILEDTTLSTEERIAALDKVTAATKQLAINQKEETQAALAQAQAELVNIQNYEERRQKQLEISDLQGKLIEQTTALQSIEYDAAKVAREIRQAEADEKQRLADEETARKEKEAEEARKLAEEQQKLRDEAIKAEQDRRAAIDDMVIQMYLEGIESAKERAYEELRISEETAMAELENLKATEEEKQVVREGYAAMRRKLEKETSDQELAIIQGSLGAIGDAFGEGTEAYKLFKSAETLISTYSAAQKAFESAQDLPFGLGAIIGPAAAAAAVASGLQSVQKIMNTQVPEPPKPTAKAAYGGFIKGNSHDTGGVPIEAEGGEFILNKYAMRQPGMAQIAQSLNSIATPSNQLGGGAPLKTYVVATEVTTAQEANSKIEKLARL